MYVRKKKTVGFLRFSNELHRRLRKTVYIYKHMQKRLYLINDKTTALNRNTMIELDFH